MAWKSKKCPSIRNLVDSYMRITTKAIKDLVPKAIMHLIVNQVSSFTKDELLYQCGDTDGLMEESAGEAQKREEMLRLYHACREALQIISEVNMSTLGSDGPPPISRPAPVPPVARPPPAVPARGIPPQPSMNGEAPQVPARPRFPARS